MVPYKNQTKHSTTMNTIYTSLAVIGIILILILMFGKEIASRRKTNQAKRIQYMEDLKERCRQEQGRLTWIISDIKNRLHKTAENIALTTRDTKNLNEKELQYLLRKINLAIQKIGAGEVKHPDAQSRAGVLAENIEKLKTGNARTSRAGRAAAHAAKYKGIVKLSADQQKQF